MIPSTFWKLAARAAPWCCKAKVSNRKPAPMIETFPLKRAIPMIFRGSGDCTKVDWTFLGLSIANWSFLAFVAIGLYAAWLLLRQLRMLRRAW